MKDHFGAVALGTIHLDQRCGSRHDDDSSRPITLCSIRHALGMIACRCGDQTLGTFLLGQGTHFIVGSPNLISSGKLHVFGLQENPVSGLTAEIVTVYQFCLQCYLFYDLTSSLKAFQR